ncbi:MAG TPA: hydantoinase/oxoprolinase family protein [Acidimicrobiia bacterium]|nr:hydantoinase/oxoprolinase family protein [Acidimicrobiia bacterium]
MTLGVDVGGTFTDLVWWDGARLHVGKITSTADQSVGVVDGAAALTAGSRIPLLVHGTTVATNALLERRGARVGLVTNPGFEDLVEIARQDRPSLYDPDVTRAEPLVPRHHRFGGPPPASADLDAVAVLLIDSYADPTRELELAEQIRRLRSEWQVIASSEVSREFREYERLSTTVLTAYLRPVVERYLAALEHRTEAVADRVLVMQSSGGLVPADAAGAHAASILLSGPAGGVTAAAVFGRLAGHRDVISFDMGGTSTDVCRIHDGRPEIVFERTIEGHVCRLPSVAVHTVGAGGGSIGWVDEGGSLRVGPRSAGAFPGPASYRRGGGEATVTDADLVIGRLGADVSLADGLELDHGSAREALARLGDRLGLASEAVALGVVEIVEAHMERAVRRVSVEEGFDPADAALVAFGGAGGMHADPLARRLGIGTVIVPPHSGVLSALGLLLAAPRVDGAHTVLTDPMAGDELDRAAARIAVETRRSFRTAVGPEPEEVAISVDMRYVGQAHETTVPFRPGEPPESLVDRFHEAHRRRNGFDRPDDAVEAVTVRASAAGRPAVSVESLPGLEPAGEAEVGRRHVLTASGSTDVAVFRRPGLRPGREIRGPAVVVDGDSTTWIDHDSRMVLHESGSMVIEHA